MAASLSFSKRASLFQHQRLPQQTGHLKASQLYSVLANFYFRSKGLWSAKGKTIPRRLKKVDAEFAAKFLSAFDAAYRDGRPDDIVSLASDLLANHDGFLFEGYRVDAPPEWRKK